MHVPLEQAVQTSPWWQVPESLIKKLLTDKENLLLDNILQTLQESYPNIYWAYRYDILEKKVKRLLQRNKDKSDVWNLILQQFQS